MSDKYYSKCRFFLYTEQRFLFPENVKIFENWSTGRTIYIVDNAPISNIDKKFRFEPFSGVTAVNGDIYENDLVSYKGQNCEVVYDDVSNRFYLKYGDSQIFLDEIDTRNLEITGDCHFGPFNAEESDDFKDLTQPDISCIIDSDDEEADSETDTDAEDSEYSYEDSDSYLDDDDKEKTPSKNFDAKSYLSSLDDTKDDEDSDSEDEDDEEADSYEDEELIEEPELVYEATGEEFSWDETIANVLDTAFLKKMKKHLDVFITSVVDINRGRGAYAVYVKASADEQETLCDVVNSEDKGLLELKALHEVLDLYGESYLYRLHIDNGFLLRVIKSEDYMPDENNAALVEEYFNIEPKIKKGKFLIFKEEAINPDVEILIARDTARTLLLS